MFLTHAQAAEYTIVVEPEYVRATVALSFQQNLTLLDPSLTIPSLNAVFASQNSTTVASAIAGVLQSSHASAAVDELSMEFRSGPWNREKNLQSINMSLTFIVRGVVERRDGAVLVDMGWKSFKVAEDITVQGVTVNRIGEKYFADTAQRLAESQPPTDVGGLRVYWEGLLVPTHGVREVLSRVSTLDFSTLKKPLSEWDHSLDLEKPSTRFSLNTGTRAVMSLTIRIPDPDQEVTIAYALITKLDAVVEAAGLAVPEEDLLVVDPGSTYQPTLMALTLGLAVVIFIVSSFFERRINRPYSRRVGRPVRKAH